MLNINFNPFPEIRTERILLRQIAKMDVNELFFLRSDERVMKYIGRPKARSKEEIIEYIEKLAIHLENNESITWAISLPENAKLIGTICIWNIKKEHYRGEVGYMLRPDYHGKGIMHEAINEVLHYAFNVIKLHSVEANINPENTGSIKLLERNNFVREAYFRENYFSDGKFLDSAIYSLISPLK